MKADGRPLYAGEKSQWDTDRYDFANPFVRRYLIDGMLSLVKDCRIGGIRIDNYGGIASLPGGIDFLKQLKTELRQYAPEIYINDESFGGDNQITRRMDQGGHGANSHNDGDFFDYIFKYAQKSTDEQNIAFIRYLLTAQWGWNESAKLTYITNHDEAANGRGGATGSYFATLVNGGGWNHVEGKTRVLSALAMLSSSYYLDMLQLRILQEGGYHRNPDVEWDLLQNSSQRHVYEFLGDLSRYFTTEKAFAFPNRHAQIFNHGDEFNKLVSLERIDHRTGKHVYVLINLSHKGFSNYRFGVGAGGCYKVVVDSDRSEYGGSHRLANETPNGLIQTDPYGMHGKAHNIRIPYIGPEGVVVIEQKL
jgi:1,4-alpha-glucan branching enzyme